MWGTERAAYDARCVGVRLCSSEIDWSAVPVYCRLNSHCLHVRFCAPKFSMCSCRPLEMPPPGGTRLVQLSLDDSHPESRCELISMTIDLSVLEEEYEKMTNTPVVAVRPPASCSQAQKASSFLSVCPTGLAALDCRPLLNTSVEEIMRSPVALPHGLGSKSWPIAPGLR